MARKITRSEGHPFNTGMAKIVAMTQAYVRRSRRMRVEGELLKDDIRRLVRERQMLEGAIDRALHGEWPHTIADSADVATRRAILPKANLPMMTEEAPAQSALVALKQQLADGKQLRLNL